MVENALTLVSMCSMTHVVYEKKELVKEIHWLARLGVGLK